MMAEWNASKTQIAPWFLDKPITSIEEFARFIKMLDDCEHGIVDKKYAVATSYFVVDDNGKLIGATSLRHYLTIEGYKTWGHIGYGARPCERLKGCAVQMLRLMMEQAKEKKIYSLNLVIYSEVPFYSVLIAFHYANRP